MYYGKIIKANRDKNFFSQQKLANILGVSLITISRWEQSKYSPTIKKKKKLKKIGIIT